MSDAIRAIESEQTWRCVQDIRSAVARIEGQSLRIERTLERLEATQKEHEEVITRMITVVNTCDSRVAKFLTEWDNRELAPMSDTIKLIAKAMKEKP